MMLTSAARRLSRRLLPLLLALPLCLASPAQADKPRLRLALPAEIQATPFLEGSLLPFARATGIGLEPIARSPGADLLLLPLSRLLPCAQPRFEAGLLALPDLAAILTAADLPPCGGAPALDLAYAIRIQRPAASGLFHPAGDRPPRALLFDPETAPGLRTLPPEPEAAAELLLLADGVPADGIAATLESDGMEGLARRLRRIRPHLIRSHSPRRPAPGAWRFSLGPQISGATPPEDWEQLILEPEAPLLRRYGWAVPPAAARRADALRLVSYTLQPEQQRALHPASGLSPVTRSGLAEAALPIPAPGLTVAAAFWASPAGEVFRQGWQQYRAALEPLPAFPARPQPVAPADPAPRGWQARLALSQRKGPVAAAIGDLLMQPRLKPLRRIRSAGLGQAGRRLSMAASAGPACSRIFCDSGIRIRHWTPSWGNSIRASRARS